MCHSIQKFTLSHKDFLGISSPPLADPVFQFLLAVLLYTMAKYIANNLT